MYSSFSYICPYVLMTSISLLFVFTSYHSFGQVPSKINDSTLEALKYRQANFLDSNRPVLDSTLKDIRGLVDFRRKQLDSQFEANRLRFQKNFSSKPSIHSDSIEKKLLANPYAGLFKFSDPWLSFGSGYLAYNYDYRSSADTPYNERNISQHIVNGSMNFSIEKSLPFIANVWIRRSNSELFSNITDVQIIFNSAAFRGNIGNTMKQRFQSIASGLKDSVLEKTYFLKSSQLKDLNSWLQNPFTVQKLIQANEIYRIPQKSYNPALPDSTNKKNAAASRKLAKDYIDLYNKQKVLLGRIKKEQDSLANLYKKMYKRIEDFRQMLKGGAHDPYALKSLEDSARAMGAKNLDMPAGYKWLLGIRNFALGKTPVNYSDLTAKNISLTGINFEYNSWYYLALSAGLVDYRFHDFVVSRFSTTPQYMYLLRAGLGRLEKNHLIFSVFKGQKQLFTSMDSAGHLNSISVLGFGAEAKWQLNRYSYLLTEVAESLTPDYRYNPAINEKFNFSDKNDKAIAVKFYSNIPFMGFRLEGMYKYTGANFQSFSSFQTNSTLRSWYVKGDQTLLKRKLKISASLRSNDYSNPYIIQNYNSNTIFKTVSASFRTKGCPTISLAYMPMSQYSVLGSQVVENRFQTLTGNASHFYKIGKIRATTVAVLTKFYNGSTDTSFVFYNATNILVGQSLFFRDFTTNVNFSRSVSSRYTLNVAAEDVNFNLSKRMALGIGVKINNFNRNENELGQYIHLNLKVGKTDYLTLNFERGYLPGSSGGLVLNELGNVQFMKRFR